MPRSSLVRSLVKTSENAVLEKFSLSLSLRFPNNTRLSSYWGFYTGMVGGEKKEERREEARIQLHKRVRLTDQLFC